jgi:hypothetical protein
MLTGAGPSQVHVGIPVCGESSLVADSVATAVSGWSAEVTQRDAIPTWSNGIVAAGSRLQPRVSAFSEDVINAAANEKEVTLTTHGRRTGKPSDVTIFIVTDGRRLFVLSGQGMVRHWPQNLLARGEGVLHIRDLDVDVKSRHVTDPAEARKVFDLYPIKYGGRIASRKPEDPPRPSDQATFELIPAAP